VIIHKRLLAVHGSIEGDTSVTFRENNSKHIHYACPSHRTLQSRATKELDKKHCQARLKHNHDMPEPTRNIKCTINYSNSSDDCSFSSFLFDYMLQASSVNSSSLNLFNVLDAGTNINKSIYSDKDIYILSTCEIYK
jgi:hypothetical protein